VILILTFAWLNPLNKHICLAGSTRYKNELLNNKSQWKKFTVIKLTVKKNSKAKKSHKKIIEYQRSQQKQGKLTFLRRGRHYKQRFKKRVV
jgi:hypothetical protein